MAEEYGYYRERASPPTGRIIPKDCLVCRHNDEEFDNDKCLSCRRNPLLDDNYTPNGPCPECAAALEGPYDGRVACQDCGCILIFEGDAVRMIQEAVH